jgi:hypothetical protein
VKELKRASNLWLKERGRDYADFEWQGGYADFSVCGAEGFEIAASCQVHVSSASGKRIMNLSGATRVLRRG